MKNKKVFIFNTGCEKRFLDSERAKDYFKKNNWKIVKDPDKADLILYTTCAVNKNLEDVAVKNIIKFKKFKTKLIVSGCLPKINKDRLKKHFNGSTLSPDSLEEIDKLFPKNKVKFNQVPDANTFKMGKLSPEQNIWTDRKGKQLAKDFFKQGFDFFDEKLKGKKKEIFYLRIATGCFGNCSYCGIKKAVGRLKSKPLKECIREFDQGLKKGFKRFAIQAEDTGGYGLDTNTKFSDLLKEILKRKEDFQIYIGNLNPVWLWKFKDDLLEVFRSKKIVKVECPIQSGNDRILRLMNRYPPSSKELISIFQQLKKVNPSLKLKTDIIVGFPTEKEADFKKTLDFIKKIKFSDIVVFKFHGLPGTKAERLNKKLSINGKLLDEREKRIRQLAKKRGIKIIKRMRDGFW